MGLGSGDAVEIVRSPSLWVPWEPNPKGQPFGGCFPSNPPQDGPPNLGIARICWGVFLVESLPIFTDLYRLSWANILSP